MSRILKHDTNGTKPLLSKGEFGYDDYEAGGDSGRVYIGTGNKNIPLADKESTSVTMVAVNQSAHGFNVLDALKVDNSGVYVKAKADSENNMAVGLVVKVIDADNFVIAQNGYFKITGHGLTVGNFYYLSGSSAGGITENKSSITQDLLYVLDNDNVLINVSFGLQPPSQAPLVSYYFSSNDANDIDKTSVYSTSGTSNVIYNTSLLLHIERAFSTGVSAFQMNISSSGKPYYRFATGIPTSRTWSNWSRALDEEGNWTVGGKFRVDGSGNVFLEDGSILRIQDDAVNGAEIRILCDSNNAWFQVWQKGDTNTPKSIIFSGYGGADIDNFQVKKGGTFRDIMYETHPIIQAIGRVDQSNNWLLTQTGSIETNNSLNFNCATGNNKKGTPTGNTTLQFTNIVEGFTGSGSIDNSGGYIISAASHVVISPSALTRLSTAGRYPVSFYSPNSTQVEVTVGEASTVGGS